jgi:uncharacterized membrane protein YdjX (TVP38/TMEM64 family)
MRLLAWFLGLMGLVLVTWAVWGGGWEARFSFEGAVTELENAGSWAWAWGMGLLVGDIVLPIPGTVVMSALGWIYGPLIGGLFGSLGSTLAGLIAYGACRLCGDRAARWILGPKDLERGHRMFSSSGGWIVCLSRALPLLPEAVACTAGLVRMPFRRFFVALVCGSFPMGFVFAWVGATGRDSPGLAFGLSLGLPVALWLLSRLLSRRFEKRVEEEGR